MKLRFALVIPASELELSGSVESIMYCTALDYTHQRTSMNDSCPSHTLAHFRPLTLGESLMQANSFSQVIGNSTDYFEGDWYCALDCISPEFSY